MLPITLVTVADVVLFVLAWRSVIPHPGPTKLILGVLIPVCCLALFLTIWGWLDSGYSLGTKRILRTSGVGWRRAFSYRASDVVGVDLVRSPLARLFGYGTLVVTLSTGARWRRVRLRYCPYPDQMYLEMLGLYTLFGVADERDDD